MVVLLTSLWMVWSALLILSLLNMVAIYYAPLRDVMYPDPDDWAMTPSFSATLFTGLWLILTVVLWRQVS